MRYALHILFMTVWALWLISEVAGGWLRGVHTAAGLILLPLIGIVITNAIFARFPLGHPERLAIALGISVVSAIGGTFLLDRLTVGLRPETIALYFGALSFIASVLLIVRRPLPGPSPLRFLRRIRLSQAALFAGALAVTLVAWKISESSEQTQARPGFTQLWITRVDAAGEQLVTVSAVSHETSPLFYQLVVSASGGRAISSNDFELEPGQQRDFEIRTSEQGKIVARLSVRSDLVHTYREVTIGGQTE